MYRFFIIILTLASISFGLFFWSLFFSTPKTFKENSRFEVKENESLKSISERLQNEGYITSPLLFRAMISFSGKEKEIQLGGYDFGEPIALFEVVQFFIGGKSVAPLLSITVPEGSSKEEVVTIIKQALPDLSEESLKATIKQLRLEGKLFPSTYYLLPSYSEEDVINLMYRTFTKNVVEKFSGKPFEKPLRSLDEVLVLASILEGEANTEESMKMVSGILLRRMQIGMPLQVDVAMETYKKKGLPEKPINNPGLVAINAVLNPIYTDYLYYITGKDGLMYYAKTYTEHKRNIEKYLR